MAANINDLTLDQTLGLIGFDAAQVVLITESDLTSFASFRFIDEAGIHAMAEAFAKRGQAPRRVEFGMTRIKLMMGVMHLVQDYDRHGTDIAGVTLTVTLDFITEALLNAQIRKHHADNKEVASKAADPGLLTLKVDFPVWIRSFKNFLNTIPGITGIPLDYVIRDTDEQNANNGMNMDMGNMDCMTFLTLRAPLEGAVFRTDNNKVHGYLVSKVSTGPGEEWVASTLRSRDGRQAYQQLIAHFTGAGNVGHVISQARMMEHQLHYKLEKGQVPWAEFLNRANKMWNIYETIRK
jgi:hypothetical protein